MIAYEAAPGEEVIVKGSESWKPEARPSAGWKLPPLPQGVTVWMADLPAEFFVGCNRVSRDQHVRRIWKPDSQWTERRLLLRRGAVFAGGEPLRQALHTRNLGEKDGTFWVEEPGLRVHFRLPGDADPTNTTLEVTTREQCFAPEIYGLGYIRVSGFRFEQAADGVPVPQRAMVSAMRGHYWIIEDCNIRFAQRLRDGHRLAGLEGDLRLHGRRA